MKTATMLILAIAVAPALARLISSFELETRDVKCIFHQVTVLTNICMY